VRFENKESIYRFVNSQLRERVKEHRTEYARQFAEAPGEVFETPSFQRYLPAGISPLPQGQPIVSENLDLTYRPSLPFIYLGDTFVASPAKAASPS
jgi:hypothetical protein